MTVGMADTVMVTSAGEAAVSGVSLVDSINILLIQIFAALSTGGAVVVSQYLGRQDRENAQRAAKQLLYAVGGLSLGLTAFALLLREHLLRFIFGSISDAVMDSAVKYFIATALAYPFIAIYNAGAALFRAMGNSKVSMVNSAIVNAVNIGVNALLIFGFQMGALGAGIGTLVSRVVAAVVILFLLQRPDCPLRSERLFHPELQWGMVKRILSIGIPNGLENGIFQVGKLVILGLVTSFDVGVDLAVVGSAVAANAICNSICSVINVPGQAMGMAMVTVVGQCMGAGEPDQAASYAKKLLGVAYLSMGVLNVALFLFAGPLTGLFNLEPASRVMAEEILRWNAVFAATIWPASFALPNALRAAGDARFTMVVSMCSMFLFRVCLSYVLGSDQLFGLPMAGLHLLGVWLAMYVDWMVRASFFTARFLRGKWKTIHVI